MPNVSYQPLASSIISAAQRILGRPRVKKDPVTLEMLKALEQSRITDKSPSLSDLRTVSLCVVGFVGFFRFSGELCLLKAFPSHLSIFLESSKTDQYRNGAWIAIARTGQLTCPVDILERYIVVAHINLSEDLPLFRTLAAPRSKEKVRRPGISYT